MTIFNSLGSNYTFSSAVRILITEGSASTRRELIEYLEQRYGGKAVLVYKGRDALLLGLKSIIGSEKNTAVAINGFTCVALYDAVVRAGATPILLDIAGDALDFSPESLRGALNTHKNIKAVVVQNTLGFPCRGREIADLCKERGVALVEDLAHSIGARYVSGEEAGTVGDFVILSFSQDKVVDSVSGGALIIRNKNLRSVEGPTQTPSWSRQLKERIYPIITWKIRASYAFGIGKFYHAVVRACNLLPRPLDENEPCTMPPRQTSIALSGLNTLERVAEHRRLIAHVYAQTLDTRIFIPAAISTVDASANLRFPILVENRDALIAYLRTCGIHVSDIWYDAPIAPKKYREKIPYVAGTCPHAEKVADTMVNLPTHINVSPTQAKNIAEEVNRFIAQNYGTHS